MKVVLQSVFLLAVFLVAGCSSEPDLSDPRVVVEEFTKAVAVDQNREKAAEFVIEREREDFLEAFDEIMDMAEKHPYPEDPSIAVDVDGDRAKAVFENWDAASGALRLERVDGVWWVVN